METEVSFAKSSSRDSETFEPRPSNGRTWTFAIGSIALLLFVIPVALIWIEIPTLGALVATIPLLLLGIVSAGPILVVAWYASSLHYELRDDELILRCGPLMSDRIRLNEIISVTMHDKLRMSLLASFRFPGLALFDVDYADVNRVRMCATSASQRILLIETDRKRYGITPRDEVVFLDSLQKRIDDPSVVRAIAGTSEADAGVAD
jgi:hypothetical protein